MSFILDALKKSETERAEQGSAEFSSVPSSAAKPSPSRWIWMLVALLGINVAVLMGISTRPDTPPDSETAIEALPSGITAIDTEVPPPAAADANVSFEDRVAAAIEEQPQETTSENTEPVAGAVVAAHSGNRWSGVPTIDQLRLNGSLQFAELHLDIHVYSDAPNERFVFINMVKHREQSRLAEGPIVTEITPNGVILEHQGNAFLLPRE